VIRDQPNVAALRAVTTVGPSARHMGLAAKRDRARATIATTHIDSTFVDETRHRPQATGGPYDIGSDNPLLAIGGGYAMTRTGSPDTRTT
jgi:hypothetical protein